MNRHAEKNPWVVRTDFSDVGKWEHIREQIGVPQKDGDNEFFAYVKYVDDKKYRDQAPKDVVPSLPDTYTHMFCFIVDQESIRNQEHPIVVVGFYPSDGESFDRPPRNTPLSNIATFRALPSQILVIENNLSIANMDYEEFADSVDSDGVFRGFRDKNSPPEKGAFNRAEPVRNCDRFARAPRTALPPFAFSKVSPCSQVFSGAGARSS